MMGRGERRKHVPPPAEGEQKPSFKSFTGGTLELPGETWSSAFRVWPPSCHVYSRKVESKEWWREGESGRFLPVGVVPDNGKERSEVLFGEDSEQIGIGKKWSESLWNDNVQGSHDHQKLRREQTGKREQERNKTKYCIKSECFKKNTCSLVNFQSLNRS